MKITEKKLALNCLKCKWKQRVVAIVARQSRSGGAAALCGRVASDGAASYIHAQGGTPTAQPAVSGCNTMAQGVQYE